MCTACQTQVDCSCMDNSDYQCPQGVINGWYDYDSCECRCFFGWTGYDCNLRDTSFYVSFRYGDDSTLLNNSVRTTNYRLVFDTVEIHLPSGNEIETITLTNLPTLPEVGPGNSTPFCVTDTFCTNLSVVFSNGENGHAISGVFTSDSLVLVQVPGWSPIFIGIIWGTFEANLSISGTGNDYYLREGVFRLPLPPVVR